MTRYNQVPWPLRPLVEVYGWTVALLLYIFFASLRLSSSLQIMHIPEDPPLDPSSIWASWHEDVVLNFVLLPLILKKSSAPVWLNHPAWTMRPIHHLMRLFGIKVIMAATGQGGKQGMEELNRQLIAGGSTIINPDGPAGPKYVLKRGVVQMAAATARPVVTMRYKCNRYWSWPGWDSKRVPYPFSRIELHLETKIFQGSEDQLAQNISESLAR